MPNPDLFCALQAQMRSCRSVPSVGPATTHDAPCLLIFSIVRNSNEFYLRNQ
jgi:hypothetical protein